MPRFVVQGVLRDGHNGSFRLGRRWPSNQQTEIEILDQDQDPDPLLAKADAVPTFGRQSFAKLTADPFLKVMPAGDPMTIAKAAGDVPALNAEIERLTEENRQLKEQLGHGGESKEGREPSISKRK